MNLRRPLWTAAAVTVCAMTLVASCSSSGGNATSTPPGSSASGSSASGSSASGSSGPSGSNGSSSEASGSSSEGSGSSSEGSGSAASGASGGAGNANLVTGGTIKAAISADPGDLSPQNTADSGAIALASMAYDTLVSLDSKGDLVPHLASSWSNDGLTYTFQLTKGVTCADGSAVDAKLIAENINFAADKKNKLAAYNFTVPADATAAAAGTDTVTMTLAKPTPFPLKMLAAFPIVCQKGLDDRKLLKTTTQGSGPYVLTTRKPNDHYTYTVRSGYTWGANGATTGEPGQPKTVTFQVVTNMTTAANLLLSGGLNIATVTGADVSRLEAAKLFHDDQLVPQGEFFFDTKKGSIISELNVRKAVIMAVDMTQLRNVFSAGKGQPIDQLGYPPQICPNPGSVDKYGPHFDVAGAKALLDSSGWKVGSGGIREKDGKKLSLTLIYDSTIPAEAPASEYAVAQWKAVGIDVKAVATDVIGKGLFGTETWDMAWQGIGTATPDQMVPFFTGDAPPDGNNFGRIDNPEYQRLTDEAAKLAGKDGCSLWTQAENELLKAVDIYPFSAQQVPTWGNGVTFSLLTQGTGVDPTTLRQTK